MAWIVLGWDGADRYLIAEADEPEAPGRIADVAAGNASPVVPVGSILAMVDPDDFRLKTGPRAADALKLAP